MNRITDIAKGMFKLVAVAATVVILGTSLSGLAETPQAHASNQFTMSTGYYLGTGTTRSISGLGFRPDVVIIKSDTAAGQLVWKSSAMPNGVSAYLGVATADNTEFEITLDADGFTVSGALEVNTPNINYVFIALAGSDCTENGIMCVGSYTGDSASTQHINTGFAPDLAIVKRTTAVVGTFRTSLMATNYAGFFSATANNNTGAYFTTFDSSGFTVGPSNNTNSGVFYFLAFKQSDGKVKVGSFLGTGVDNRDITGVGFEPDFVLVKQDSATVPAFNTTEMYGDYSSFTTATASAINNIQELQADGFQVGTSTSVNALGVSSHYFAFGGASVPSPAGTFLMERGTYTGNGTSQTIETSFPPNLVIIKGNTVQYGVWSTSLEVDATEYFAGLGNAFTGGITGMSNSGFSVGTHATVNLQDVSYEYVAFGNATSPRRGNGAADFFIGSYTGNGIDGRAIDHLGFAPSLVVVKKSTGTGSLGSYWATSNSAMEDNTTALFSATADVTNGTSIKKLNADGFTIGSSNTVNLAGATYNWFAFREGSGFDLGSYTGNAQDNRTVTGVGFHPDFVWVKRTTASAAVHRISTLAENQSLHFLNLANDTNDIKSFDEDGFTLGTSAEVNASGGVIDMWRGNAPLPLRHHQRQ